MNVIGIDCSTNPAKTGMALAVMEETGPLLHSVQLGSRSETPERVAFDWLERHGPALLALDAPLGWPQGMTRGLTGHQAGRPLLVDANLMFRRRTDDHIYSRHGKRSLDVGSNLIARTAHAALCVLENLRELASGPIPLAWSEEGLDETAAIEVYPAATRLAHGIAPGVDPEPFLRERMRFSEGIRLGEHSDHVRDAVLCVLAGLDFLSGRAEPPKDLDLARSEGWIWCAAPAAAS